MLFQAFGVWLEQEQEAASAGEEHSSQRGSSCKGPGARASMAYLAECQQGRICGSALPRMHCLWDIPALHRQEQTLEGSRSS